MVSLGRSKNSSSTLTCTKLVQTYLQRNHNSKKSCKIESHFCYVLLYANHPRNGMVLQNLPQTSYFFLCCLLFFATRNVECAMKSLPSFIGKKHLRLRILSYTFFFGDYDTAVRFYAILISFWLQLGSKDHSV